MGPKLQAFLGTVITALWGVVYIVLLPAAAEVLAQQWLSQWAPRFTAALLVSLLGAASLYNKYRDNLVARFLYQYRAARWAGISQVYPVSPYPPGTPAPNSDVKRLANGVAVAMVRSTKDLKLLLVSGFKLLGSQKHPGLLYESIDSQAVPFKLEVLLLHPKSPAAQARAQAEGLKPEEYENGVGAVLWTLAQWARVRGFTVKASLYREDPIWQMVITPQEIWMLCATGNVSSGISPVYCFRRSAEFGLAFGLNAVWDRRVATAEPVDLMAVPQPDWDKIKFIA